MNLEKNNEKKIQFETMNNQNNFLNSDDDFPIFQNFDSKLENMTLFNANYQKLTQDFFEILRSHGCERNDVRSYKDHVKFTTGLKCDKIISWENRERMKHICSRLVEKILKHIGTSEIYINYAITQLSFNQKINGLFATIYYRPKNSTGEDEWVDATINDIEEYDKPLLLSQR